MALKGNQSTLCAMAEQLMKEAELDRIKSRQPASDGSDGRVRYGFAETVDGDHGRIETRRVLVSDEVEALGQVGRDWPGLAAIVRVESIRDVDGIVSTEHRLYLTDLKGTDAAKLGDLVRGHWSVENQLHWQLDVSFNEDQRRVRKGHGAENYSRLCRMALNLLKRDKKQKSASKANASMPAGIITTYWASSADEHAIALRRRREFSCRVAGRIVSCRACIMPGS
jgi:predicted transposase YbfD/YdcC